MKSYSEVQQIWLTEQNWGEVAVLRVLPAISPFLYPPGSYSYETQIRLIVANLDHFIDEWTKMLNIRQPPGVTQLFRWVALNQNSWDPKSQSAFRFQSFQICYICTNWLKIEIWSACHPETFWASWNSKGLEPNMNNSGWLSYPWVIWVSVVCQVLCLQMLCRGGKTQRVNSNLKCFLTLPYDTCLISATQEVQGLLGKRNRTMCQKKEGLII